jgi:hypothetical protein
MTNHEHTCCDEAASPCNSCGAPHDEVRWLPAEAAVSYEEITRGLIAKVDAQLAKIRGWEE